MPVPALPPPTVATGTVTTAATVPPPEVRPPVKDQVSAIRATLARYEAAYSGLDAAAADAVWPGVDERALARAFAGLASQRVSIDKCDVVINGATARAACSGRAEWTPKVGGGLHTQARRWAFELASAGGAWQIVSAEAR
jgi:hypothetical protein